MSSNHLNGIYRGTKFEIIRFFSGFFGVLTVKQLVFNSNGRIRIQTVKFQFKRINHESSRHYRLLAPTAGGSAGGTTGRYRPARLQRER
jgi:hypothetical protein